MSRAEKLYEAITGLPDETIEHAQIAPLRRSKQTVHWGRWAVLAACLCLIAGGGWFLNRMTACGGSSGSTSSSESSSASSSSTAAPAGGSSGHEAGTVFMSYAGPVFPLTLREEVPGLTAERTVAMDFANYALHPETRTRSDGTTETREDWNTGLLVTDRCILTNSTGADVTVEALYPFASSFPGLGTDRPEIQIDGETAEPELAVGGYCGGFQGIGGESADSGLYNLEPPDSWESYRDILADGTYLEGAFAPPPELNEPVTVYAFDEAQAPTDQYDAATLAVEFTFDPERTAVYTWYFNGGDWDAGSGRARYSFFVDKFGRWQPRYLVIQGGNIESYTVRGYENGACKREIDGVSAVITRRETTFGEILRDILANYQQDPTVAWWDGPERVPAELLYRTTAQSLVSYANAIARYGSGRLDDVVSDSSSMDRVFYLAFDITIPAESSVEVTASFTKRASYDFHCAHTENQGLSGYDLVTTLGSSLDFTSQRAELLHGELIEIVRQNFGFDPENGVTSAELDPAREHYYLEVRRKAP